MKLKTTMRVVSRHTYQKMYVTDNNISENIKKLKISCAALGMYDSEMTEGFG